MILFRTATFAVEMFARNSLHYQLNNQGSYIAYLIVAVKGEKRMEGQRWWKRELLGTNISQE